MVLEHKAVALVPLAERFEALAIEIGDSSQPMLEAATKLGSLCRQLADELRLLAGPVSGLAGTAGIAADNAGDDLKKRFGAA